MEEEDKAKTKYKHQRRNAGVAASIFLVVSLALTPPGWNIKMESGGVKILQAVILAVWTLVPPMWFWWEYFFLFPKAFPNADSDERDRFKYGQDLSAKIWLAVVSVLLILYFWKDLGKSS